MFNPNGNVHCRHYKNCTRFKNFKKLTCSQNIGLIKKPAQKAGFFLLFLISLFIEEAERD